MRLPLLIIATSLLCAGSARAEDLVGVLLDGPGAFYSATGEELKRAITASQPGLSVVVSTPAADKMARCNSARRFKKVGAKFIIAIGRHVATVTMEECDHDMLYGVYDVAPFEVTKEYATGGVWLASPAKLLLILKAVRPFQSLAIVYDSGEPESAHEVEAVKAAAGGLGVSTVLIDAAAGDLTGLADAHAVYYAALAGGSAETLERLAKDTSVPLVTSFVRGEDHGALMAWYADPAAVAQTLALQAGKLLSGRAIDEIAVVQGKISLGLNISAAKKLGVTFPKSVITAATRKAL